MHRYKLSKAGWSLGWVSAVDSNGRTNWIADADTLIHLVRCGKVGARGIALPEPEVGALPVR